jgi:hypothetical protein
MQALSTAPDIVRALPLPPPVMNGLEAFAQALLERDAVLGHYHHQGRLVESLVI